MSAMPQAPRVLRADYADPSHARALVDLLDSPSGTTRLLDEYRRRCVTVDSRVRVDLGAEGSIEGVAVGIDDDGHLVVVDDDGASHTVAVGDVVHLRPAG